MELKVSDKKRLIIVAVLLTLLIVIVVGGLVTGPTNNQKKVKPEVEKVKVPELFSEPSQSSLRYVGEDEKFPKEAETFSIDDRPLSKSEAASIASLFGFDANPLESEDRVQGVVLFWNGPAQTLRVRLKQRSVKYALKSVSVSKREVLSFDEAKKIAQEFLESKNLFQGLSFTDKFEYLTGLESSAVVVDSGSAEAIKVTLNYNVAGYPLIDEFLGVDPVSLTILNNGKIGFFSYLVFNSSDLKEGDKVEIKSLDEATKNLASGEGVAVGVLSTDSEAAPAVPSFRTLDKVYFAYFHSVKTATVQPIFVFESSGARALVPAAKTN